MKTTTTFVLLLIGLVTIHATRDDDAKRKRKPLSRPNRVKPKNDPQDVVRRDGRHRRRSQLNVDDLLLDDDEDIEIQLMRDESSMKFKLKKQDFDDDPFTSYSSTDDTTGQRITFVTSTAKDGIPVMVGTVHNANGTIYQIRQLADQELIVEEVQDGFDPEYKGQVGKIKNDQNHDEKPKVVDVVDGVVTDQSDDSRYLRSGGERRLVDDGTVLDVMVRVLQAVTPTFEIDPHSHLLTHSPTTRLPLVSYLISSSNLP